MTVAERAAAGFLEEYGVRPGMVVTAPGRINLIGEHTDYQGGLVLPAAIDLCVAAAARPAKHGLVRTASRRYPDRVSFCSGSLSPESPIEGWGRFVAGTAWALVRSGLPAGDADIYIESDIPPGAGLGSSAALEVASGFALLACAGEAPKSPEGLRALAEACQDGENEYCGVPCGLMDHMASCFGIPWGALLLDCRSLEITPVPLPPGISIVICDSGERHDLATAGYADRRSEASAALGYLRTRRPEIESLRDATPGDLELLSEAVAASGAPPAESGKLQRRAEHIIMENRRVVLAAEALAGGDVLSIGRLLREAHASLRDLCEVSTAGIDMLVDAASSMPGCLGARLTGGGFGGSVVCLVDSAATDGFLAVMSKLCPGGARLVRLSGGVAMERIQ